MDTLEQKIKNSETELEFFTVINEATSKRLKNKSIKNLIRFLYILGRLYYYYYSIFSSENSRKRMGSSESSYADSGPGCGSDEPPYTAAEVLENAQASFLPKDEPVEPVWTATL